MRRMLKELYTNKTGDVVINDAVTVEKDGDVEVGKDLRVDGKIKVNSAADVVDEGGTPIASTKYKHYIKATDADNISVATFVVETSNSAEITSITEIPTNEDFLCSFKIGSSYGIGSVSITESDYTIRGVSGTTGGQAATWQVYNTITDEITVTEEPPL